MTCASQTYIFMRGTLAGCIKQWLRLWQPQLCSGASSAPGASEEAFSLLLCLNEVDEASWAQVRSGGNTRAPQVSSIWLLTHPLLTLCGIDSCRYASQRLAQTTTTWCMFWIRSNNMVSILIIKPSYRTSAMLHFLFGKLQSHLVFITSRYHVQYVLRWQTQCNR